MASTGFGVELTDVLLAHLDAVGRLEREFDGRGRHDPHAREVAAGIRGYCSRLLAGDICRAPRVENVVDQVARLTATQGVA